jgi:hypothetical protein
MKEVPRMSLLKFKSCVFFLGLISSISFSFISCNSKDPVTPAATALTLLAPANGASFSFNDTITVKWKGNPDSIGTPPLQSFTMEYSLDSGFTWIKMTYAPESVLDDQNGNYQMGWLGLDTNYLNPVTMQPLTKSDFLNKGIIIHIVSYPPKSITRQSGYIFFHE